MTRRFLLAAAILLLAGSCSEEDPEPTAAELLAEIEGRELTDAEVSEREEVANLLCGLGDDILVQIWSELDSEDLAFQDYVFGRVCAERTELYGNATGRFVTESGTPGDDDPEDEAESGDS